MQSTKHRAKQGSAELLAKRRAAGVLGGLRTKQRWQMEKSIPLDTALAEDLRKTAIEYGFPPPQTVEEAIKLKDFMIREEKRQKLQIDREYALSSRIDVALVDDFMSRVSLVMNKALDTVHHILDDLNELTDGQKLILRRRLRDWADSTTLLLSQAEIYQRESNERTEPVQSGESEQPVVETPEEIPAEED